MNNFANSTHAELHLAAMAAAGTLRISADVQERLAQRKYVTKLERQLVRPHDAFGADRTLADLLEALAAQVHHGPHVEGDAAQLLQAPGATLCGVFGPLLVERQRNVRHQLVLDAANLVLRKRAAEWLHREVSGSTQHARALASNSGLAAVLEELQKLRVC